MKTETLKSLQIDVEKGIYMLNGENISDCVDEFNLTFENGIWGLTIRKRVIYESPARIFKE